jgi:hypothetical protein
MPALTVQELKKAIQQAGLEVYRTRGNEVHLAERPRENLIMDAGVSVLLAISAPAPSDATPPPPSVAPAAVSAPASVPTPAPISAPGSTAADGSPGLARVRFIVRAQKADFHGEDDTQLFERARLLGSPVAGRGYVEVERRARAMPDPGDPSRVLDTWFEILFERHVQDVSEILDEARLLLTIEKAASR